MNAELMQIALTAAPIMIFVVQALAMKWMRYKSLKNLAAVMGMTSILMSVMLAVWAVWRGEGMPDTVTILCALLFGVTFPAALLGFFFSISKGPLAVAALYQSSGLLVPVITGMVFWNEAVTVTKLAGIILIMTAIYLMSGARQGTGKLERAFILSCTISFCGNGALSLAAKFKAELSPNAGLSGYLSAAFLISACVCFAVSRLAKSEGEPLLKKGFGVKLAILVTTTLLGNYAVTAASALFDISYLIPVIQGSVFVLNTLVGALFFREKMSRAGKIGALIGLSAIIALNLTL